MRIIHTADWHLGDWLGKIRRNDDFKSRVETVAHLCEEHAADVLLIAGDVFSEQASVEDMTRSLQHISDCFKSFFSRGGTILAITGNHDRDNRINMVRAGMSLASPSPAGGQLECGRMYLENELKLVSLVDPNGERVQFVLVPYPTVSRFVESTDVYRTKDEENQLLHLRITEWLATVPLQPDYNAKLPTVLVAHLHVRGSEAHSLYKLDEVDDIVFDPEFLPTGWTYAALGHIHRPQTLNGLQNVRYSGSLDRCDFGELGQSKEVVLIDVGPSGLRGQPLSIPIGPTPLYDVVINSPAVDLPQIEAMYPDHEAAIVRVQATHQDGMSRDEITRELRRLFPRLYDLKWIDIAAPVLDTASAVISPRGGPRQVIGNYLATRLQDDPDKDEILALVENYIAEEEQR
jgi:DNA repair protein SbcD/Mre11